MPKLVHGTDVSQQAPVVSVYTEAILAPDWFVPEYKLMWQLACASVTTTELWGGLTFPAQVTGPAKHPMVTPEPHAEHRTSIKDRYFTDDSTDLHRQRQCGTVVRKDLEEEEAIKWR